MDIDFNEQNFFQGKKVFFKNLELNKRCEKRSVVDNKILAVKSGYCLPKNRFHDLWSSQRQPARVRVKILPDDVQPLSCAFHFTCTVTGFF